MQVFANPITTAPMSTQQAADSSTQTSSANSNSNTATVTANDFLQLLVTEMKNQDPTSTTDPNEYIDQLVQVNSLEQLISINQDLSPLAELSGDVGSSGNGSGGTGGAVSGVQAQSPAASAAAAGNLSATDTGGRASHIANALNTAAKTLAPGATQGPMSGAIQSLHNRAKQAHTFVSNPAH